MNCLYYSSLAEKIDSWNFRLLIIMICMINATIAWMNVLKIRCVFFSKTHSMTKKYRFFWNTCKKKPLNFALQLCLSLGKNKFTSMIKTPLNTCMMELIHSSNRETCLKPFRTTHLINRNQTNSTKQKPNIIII